MIPPRPATRLRATAVILASFAASLWALTRMTGAALARLWRSKW